MPPRYGARGFSFAPRPVRAAPCLSTRYQAGISSPTWMPARLPPRCRDWQQGSTTMRSNALGFASILAGGLTLLPLLVEPDPPAARAPAPSQQVLSAGDAGPICAPPPADRAGADDLSPPRRCSPIGERLAKAR